MISTVRKEYNEFFTEERYQAFLQDLDQQYPGTVEFRLAETPVFVPQLFLEQMQEVCAYLIDFICAPNFKALTERGIPAGERVANENDHAHFISFDFGVCRNEAGELVPQLIELQGFATLFAFQVLLPDAYRAHFKVPEAFHYLLPPFEKREAYIQLLQEVIVGDVPVENVILLEIKPHEQKTRIDFYATRDYLGIEPVCITELIADGDKLFYRKEGRLVQVKRIYNRIIFDELNEKRHLLGDIIDMTRPWDVEWVAHPNWFYRISKFTLPFVRHPFVPATYFLNEVKQLPDDLDQYVLKPLFSFAGQGVVIDIVPSDILGIADPENWILQRKVQYADVIETPDGAAKCELRLMYFWKDGEARPVLANNLARLSKGKMIGTRYNKDKTWVGGSACFFE